ncbi:MAG: SagB family peptide dehydrogenase [Trueperaceae bacterium]|nr:SagB family peptide dehydrogenase [Trueperaceae bacterium]
MRDRRTSHDPFEATKYARGRAPVTGDGTVAGYKIYANPQEFIRLPAARRSAGPGVWDVMSGVRGGACEGGAVTQPELAQTLWATAGLVESGGRTHAVPAPASGLEIYVLSGRVRDLSTGSYHYEPRGHALEQLSTDDPRPGLTGALFDQGDLDPYAAALVVTGVPARWRTAYGSRTHRLLTLEAGAAVQAAALAAEALGLTSRLVANFFDDEVASLLRLDPVAEPALAVVLLGR